MSKKNMLLAIVIIALNSCTKNTNNYYGSGASSFAVMGITDITLTNSSDAGTALPISVTYFDSSQENVSLVLSGLPEGIKTDSTAIMNGIPTYSTTLTFYDSTVSGASPGTYPITLTATSSSGESKSYKFNMIVVGSPACSAYITGEYSDCSSYYGSFSDSVYADPIILNKVWFKNYANSGVTVFGKYNCSKDSIIIPSQIVNDTAFSGTGIAVGSHMMQIQVRVNYTYFIMTMQ